MVALDFDTTYFVVRFQAVSIGCKYADFDYRAIFENA